MMAIVKQIRKNFVSSGEFSKTCKNLSKMLKMQRQIQKIPSYLNIVEPNLIQFYRVQQYYNFFRKGFKSTLNDKIRMIKNKKIKRNWSQEDLKILFWVISHYTVTKNIMTIQQMTSEDWCQISNLIPGTTGISCMFRILSLKKTRLSQQQWDEEQSNLLYKIVETKRQLDWKIISEQLFLLNKSPNKIFRNAKQCKQHWSCFLNPKLKKGPWQANQDVLLLERILQNDGKKRWTQLVKYFEGRTENALKNRFCLIIQRTKIECNEKQQIFLIQFALKKLKLKNKQKRATNNFSPFLKYDTSSSPFQKIHYGSLSKIEQIKFPIQKTQSTSPAKTFLKQDPSPLAICSNVFFSALVPSNQIFFLYNQPNLSESSMQ